MKKRSLVLIYATRLARREWKRFLLPFLSLTITAVVLSLTLLLTSASSTLLKEESKILLGGDVIVESTSPVPTEIILANFNAPPRVVSKQLSFTATIESEASALAVSMRVVDSAWPVYGEAKTSEGNYALPLPEEIILDQASAADLQVGVGDIVRFGSVPFTVRSILTDEPTSLLSTFRFLPRVLLSDAGFLRSGVSPALLRAEYEYIFGVDTLSKTEIERLSAFATDSKGQYQVRIAGVDQGGLQVGLGLVRDFLVVAILITAILATVNVYASTVYLITIERKSFAILLSLGLSNKRLAGVLVVALGYVVGLATFFGVLLGKGIFVLITLFAERQFAITLPSPEYLMVQGFTILFLFLIALSAFIPTLQYVLSLRPKQILAGERSLSPRADIKRIVLITSVTLLPLVGASVLLLDSFVKGIGVMLGVGVAYVVIAGLFSLALTLLYKARTAFPFWLRSILAYKYADGLFGIVSFTSLFIALASLSSLVLLQISLERYFTNDLARTVPSSYVIDVQPSQQADLVANFPEITLFPNTPARIISIDEVNIQDELAAGTEEVDREFGREFNLTARANLLTSEAMTAGEEWTGKAGEISVDEAFAKRANIVLGSRVVFSVQGFLIEGVVTNFRKTDARSGLPFFYFVLAPADLERFPTVYFGYAYQSEAKQSALSRYVATAMPNVTVLKTQALAPLILKVTGLLLLIVFVVAVPPLFIAILLIVTLIISSYGTRRLEAARQRALGASVNKVLVQYLLETSALTVGASVLVYGFGVMVANGVSQYYLKLEGVVLFDRELVLGLLAIVLLMLLLGTYLFKTDTMKLRELLSYGDH